MRKCELIEAILSPDRRGHDKAVPWKKDELTHRQVEAVVTAVFGSIVDALRNGETVQLPFGTFEVIDQPRPPMRRWLLGRVRVTYAKRKTIRFTFGE